MGTSQDYAVAVEEGRHTIVQKLHGSPALMSTTAVSRGVSSMSRESALRAKTQDTNGLPRLLAQRARLLRPRRGVSATIFDDEPARAPTRRSRIATASGRTCAG